MAEHSFRDAIDSLVQKSREKFNRENNLCGDRLKNIESWVEKKQCWLDAFLIWNRSHPELYNNFPNELKDAAALKGINLIIDTKFDISLINTNPRFFKRSHPAFVLLSPDFLDSKECLLEIASMYELEVKLQGYALTFPILYYSDPQINESTYFQGLDFDQVPAMTDKANTILGIPEYRKVLYVFFSNIFDRYLLTKKAYKPLCSRDDKLFFDKIVTLLTSPNFYLGHVSVNYSTFLDLDNMALKIVTGPLEGEFTPLRYVGLISNSAQFNKIICQRVCVPRRISHFDYVHHMDLHFYSLLGSYPKSFQGILAYGLFWVDALLKTDLYRKCGHQLPLTLYRSLLSSLPKTKKGLFIIENIPHLNYLKVFASVLDFASPKSRIFFTTTHQNFSPFFFTNPSTDPITYDCHEDKLLTAEELKFTKELSDDEDSDDEDEGDDDSEANEEDNKDEGEPGKRQRRG